MTYTYLPYAITEMYCAVFAVTIWLRLSSSLGSEHEVRQLRNMIYSYLVMLVTDILWAFMECGLLRLPRLLNAVINAVIIMSIVFGCYFWFKYIEDRLHFSFGSSKLLNALLTVPLAVVCSLDLLSIRTGWIFYIDADGHYHDTELFYIHTMVNYFYLVIPTLYSIYRACRTRSRQERSEYWTYALYMIAPLAAGLLEDCFPDVPLLALNIFLMILILFLMIQNMQIYHDALTGLNNRRRLMQYLEDRLPKASPEHPVTLFILDVNRFKSINDLYGHLEGDCALQVLSAVLKAYASSRYAFVARYGGDEFCMVIDAEKVSPEAIAAEVRQRLDQAQEKSEKPYRLSVSIGCTVCSQAESVPDHVFERADLLLYEDKQQWHTHHI